MTSYCVVDQDERAHAASVNASEDLYESMTAEQVAEAIEHYDSAWIIEQAAHFALGNIDKDAFAAEIEKHVTEARNEWVGRQL